MTFQKNTKVVLFLFFSVFYFENKKKKMMCAINDLSFAVVFISLSSCVSFFFLGGGETKQNKLSNESIYNYNRMYFEMSMKTCRHKHQQNKSEFVELDLASITILI